jgi:nitrous oxide reductase
MRIENAFGILKNKWSILKNLNCDLKYARTIITSCCILHNFYIGTGDVRMDDLIDDKPNSLKLDNVVPTHAEEQSKRMGKREREALFQEWSRKHYVSK